MSDPSPHAHPVTREALALTAALLRQGERLDRLSRALTVVALIGTMVAGTMVAGMVIRASFVWYAMPMLALAALVGLVELWLAIRTGIDAALFARLAAGESRLDTLDAALAGLGLMPPAKAGRPLEARIAGARRLLRWQGYALLAQCLLFVVGPAAMFLLAGGEAR